MRLTIALLMYASCFLLLWMAYQTPEWDVLAHGFPQTSSEYAVAMIVGVALCAKLLGHVFLFASTRRH